MKEIVLLPRSAWRAVDLDVPTHKYQTPRVYEQPVRLAGRAFRQLFLQDLGHDAPTILLTNQRQVPAKALITRYAQRMRGYSDAQARQIFRDLVDMPADVTIDERQVEVRFHRRSHLPIVLASGLLDQPVPIPWWSGLALRLTTYHGPA